MEGTPPPGNTEREPATQGQLVLSMFIHTVYGNRHGNTTRAPPRDSVTWPVVSRSLQRDARSPGDRSAGPGESNAVPLWLRGACQTGPPWRAEQSRDRKENGRANSVSFASFEEQGTCGCQIRCRPPWNETEGAGSRGDFSGGQAEPRQGLRPALGDKGCLQSLKENITGPRSLNASKLLN